MCIQNLCLTSLHTPYENFFLLFSLPFLTHIPHNFPFVVLTSLHISYENLFLFLHIFLTIFPVCSCVTSNVHTKSVPNLASHPIRKFILLLISPFSFCLLFFS